MIRRSPTRGRWYRIADRREETECQWCGEPLEVGDRAYEVFEGWIGAFCARICADRWQVESDLALGAREVSH